MGHLDKKWVKKKGCDCFKCCEVEITVECKEEKKHHDCSEKKSDCDKCKGPKDKVELQNDEQDFKHERVKERSQEILEVTFDKLCFGDKVWLSGVVGFDNDNNFAVDVKLTITKRVGNGIKKTILTQKFEIDKEGHDDLTQVPFAKVDTILSEQRNVTYTVRVELEDHNSYDCLFLEGLSTLTALRVG
ncbi:hypothetical protein [Paenisporosarcina indica]|uniref:hypothetical protein n=1 Tax=Paenisporosarcina indica TaxID=650093 RepID=UPI0009502F4A|nr:hypothetical protein [Paenisporosarcina indica]